MKELCERVPHFVHQRPKLVDKEADRFGFHSRLNGPLRFQDSKRGAAEGAVVEERDARVEGKVSVVGRRHRCERKGNRATNSRRSRVAP